MYAQGAWVGWLSCASCSFLPLQQFPCASAQDAVLGAFQASATCAARSQAESHHLKCLGVKEGCSADRLQRLPCRRSKAMVHHEVVRAVFPSVMCRGVRHVKRGIGL